MTSEGRSIHDLAGRFRPARRRWLGVGAALLLTGCAGWIGENPLRVNLVGIETLPSEGMELRLLVKLRVQNAGETPIDYDGVSLDLDLRGMSFASGVSAERGTVPRFGERMIAVPMTISATALVRQALSLVAGRDQPRIRIDYAVRGRLGGAPLGGYRFESAGEVEWPPQASGPAS
jgi:LEA14-like dessication related protein